MTTCLVEPHRVKARKPHVCDWCGKRIEVGEQHTASTNVIDGIYTWRECDRCKPYVTEMMNDTDDFYLDAISDCYSGNSFIEFMRDEHPDVIAAWEKEKAGD